MANILAFGSSYTCATRRQVGALEEIYACYATIPSKTTMTISSTLYGYGDSTTVGTIVTSATSGQLVYAYGIAIARASTDPEWTTTSSSTPTKTTEAITPTFTPTSTPAITSVPTSASITSQFAAATEPATVHKDSTISTGAKIGIGIAASVGCLILIGLGYLVSRWHHRKLETPPSIGPTEMESNPAGYNVPVYREDKRVFHELPDSRRGKESLHELPTRRY